MDTRDRTKGRLEDHDMSNCPVGYHMTSHVWMNMHIHGVPQPTHPGLLVGFGVDPEDQVAGFEFSTGSVVDGTVVG